MSYGCTRNYSNSVPTGQLRQLESMYPDIYHVVYPEVFRHCNMLDNAYGQAYIPNREQLEPVIEDIYANVDKKFNNKSTEDSEQEKALQYRRGGFLNDIVWIIFLNELLGRRRRYRPSPRYRPYGYDPFSPYGPFGF